MRDLMETIDIELQHRAYKYFLRMKVCESELFSCANNPAHGWMTRVFYDAICQLHQGELRDAYTRCDKLQRELIEFKSSRAYLDFLYEREAK